MTEDNIESVRKIAIQEIKEKIKKNSKYTHPCNKERQNDEKRLRFLNGYEYTCWMQKNGILKNPVEIDSRMSTTYYNSANCKNQKEYRDMRAQKMGYKDDNDRKREWTWNKGTHLPMEFHECSANFGVYKGEELFKKFLEKVIFEDVKGSGKGSRDGGKDFICKNPKQEFIDKYPQFRFERNKEYKIQLKMRSLRDGYRWEFTHIDFNVAADYFILCAWDEREGEPIHIWIFYKYDMIKKGYNTNSPKIEFFKRTSFTIANKINKIKLFDNHELKEELNILKDICNKLYEEI